MKCPECGYTSFDYLDECRKCGARLFPVPVFKYLYGDQLGTDAVTDRHEQSAAEDAPPVEVPGWIGARTAGTTPELSPAGGLEDFLALERGLDEEITEQKNRREQEKQSPQHLPRRMVPATLGQRFFAFSVDFVFTLCVASAVLLSGANLIGETFFPSFAEFVSMWGWICLCVYLLATTYFIFLPCWSGTTLGNSVAGICVVMRDGSPVGLGTNLLRWWVGWVFSVATVFAGFALSTLDPQRKTLSDRICGTFVVKV